MVEVVTLETPELGDRSYIAHDGSTAVVIDPQRDLDRLYAAVHRDDLRVAVVAETHLHNDYVSGGLQLAQETGARYLVAAGDEIAFDAIRVKDGDRVEVGGLLVEVVATPGHTDSHVSYVVRDSGSSPADGDEQAAVFSGGCLLYGSVGRTDLVDPARTHELARAQYRSARRLAAMVPNSTPVFPTHGFGSFCSSGGATGGTSSTIGLEKQRNDALVIEDEQAFVDKLVAGLTAYPRYYAHMGVRNRQGSTTTDLSPPQPVNAAELRARITAGEWVVDLRDRVAYASEHLGGTIGIELGDQFATYLGWLIPWGTPVTLLGETPEQVADAQRQLLRIGIDRPAGAAVGTPGEMAGDGNLRNYQRASFGDLKARVDTGGITVLDVRGDDERAAGAIPGSVHVPVYSLLERLSELPAAQLWVHCQSGYRASIAASLLEGAGHDVVLVDDDYSVARDLGLATG